MKRKIKILTIISLLLIVSASFTFSIPIRANIQSQVNVSKWTVMFYFAGDQKETAYSLSDKMLEDLENLKKVGSTDDVNFLVLMDLDENHDSHLYFVQKNDVTEIPLSQLNSSWIDEVNMGKESTFYDFMEWTVVNYPAQYYNVYLNNHGGSWRGLCIDEIPSYDILDLFEMENVFSKINTIIGKKIDVVSMDACLMSTVEVAYQLKDVINYMIGHESFIYTHEENGGLFLNWLLDEIYSSMASNPSMSPKELCFKSVEEFNTDKSYVYWPYIIKPQAVDCISAIDISKINDLALALNNMTNILLSRPFIYRLLLSPVFLRTQSFGGGYTFLGLTYHSYLDLYDFASKVKRFIPNREVKESAEKVMELLDDIIIAERHGTRKIRWEHKDAHGLAIYLPYRKNTYRDGYDELGFSKDTNWDEFIKTCWLIRI